MATQSTCSIYAIAEAKYYCQPGLDTQGCADPLVPLARIIKSCISM